MNSQTLASAFQAALNRSAFFQPADRSADPDTLLLMALERSATSRDQIVQRRIGMHLPAAIEA